MDGVASIFTIMIKQKVKKLRWVNPYFLRNQFQFIWFKLRKSLFPFIKYRRNHSRKWIVALAVLAGKQPKQQQTKQFDEQLFHGFFLPIPQMNHAAPTSETASGASINGRC